MAIPIKSVCFFVQIKPVMSTEKFDTGEEALKCVFFDHKLRKLLLAIFFPI